MKKTVGSSIFEKEKPMKRNLGRALMLVALGMVAMGSRASADTAYTIDSSLSFLTASIYAGSPLSGGTQVSSFQVVGSDTSALQGALNADTSGGNISFGGGSSIGLTTFAGGNLLPDANGGDSSGPDPAGTGGIPAQLGLTLDLSPIGAPVFGFANVNTATLDVTGAGTSLGGGGSFDATAQTIQLTTAQLALWVNAEGLMIPGVGILPETLTITPGSNAIAPNGIDSSGTSNYQTGTVVGNTITLPIFADVQEGVSGITLDIVFSGQIVATAGAAVPEPSTFVLGGLGLVGSVLAYRVRRGARKV
jgi:hypothetical protein